MTEKPEENGAKKNGTYIKAALLYVLGGATVYAAPRVISHFSPRPDVAKAPTPQKLGLGEFLHLVYHELEDAERQRVADKTPPMYKAKELEIEISFVIGQDSEAKGGFTPEILTAENSLKNTAERTHKLTLHLEPVSNEETDENRDKIRKQLEKSSSHG